MTTNQEPCELDRWIMVTGPRFYPACYKCNRRMDTHAEEVFADLKGEAFKAYYCHDCWVEAK